MLLQRHCCGDLREDWQATATGADRRGISGQCRTDPAASRLQRHGCKRSDCCDMVTDWLQQLVLCN